MWIYQFVPILLVTVSIVNALSLSKDSSYRLTISSDEIKRSIASFQFDKGKSKWTATELDSNGIQSGKYCVSLYDEGETTPLLPCFNYKEITFPLNQTLLIESASDELSQIDSISLISSVMSSKLGIKIQPSKSILPPLLKANERVSLGADGKAINTTPEAEKSFIQKYWYYIVPPLLIFVLMSPQ